MYVCMYYMYICFKCSRTDNGAVVSGLPLGGITRVCWQSKEGEMTRHR